MRRLLGFITVIGITTLVGGAAQAQTLFTDDFNADTPQLAISSAFPNWTVSKGNVDIIGSGAGGTLFDFYAGQGHGYYVDLDGAVQGGITTASSFSLLPGNTYTLSFDLGKNGVAPHNMTVAVGGAFSTTVSDLGGAFTTFQPQSFTFTVGAPTSDPISFTMNTGTNAGYIVDNVSLVGTPIIVGGQAPEPASLALVGLAGVAAFAVRRRKSA